MLDTEPLRTSSWRVEIAGAGCIKTIEARLTQMQLYANGLGNCPL